MKNLFGTILNLFDAYGMRLDKVSIKTTSRGYLESFTAKIVDGSPMNGTHRKLIIKEYERWSRRDIRFKNTALNIERDTISVFRGVSGSFLSDTTGNAFELSNI